MSAGGFFGARSVAQASYNKRPTRADPLGLHTGSSTSLGDRLAGASVKRVSATMMGVLDYVSCRIRPFLWALWTCVVLPMDVFAAAPLTFSICPEEIIPTSTAMLPLIGHDVSRLSLALEADEMDSPTADTLVLRGGASLTQGARAIYADRLEFDKVAYTVRAGVKAGWSDPVRVEKLDESLLDLVIKTDIVPMTGPSVLIRSVSGDRFEADWLALEMQSQTGQAENVRFQIARRPEVVKRVIMHSDPYDAAGYSSVVAGGFASVKGPAISCCGTERPTLPRIENDKVAAPDVLLWAHGSAKRFFFEGPERERLEGVSYSRCAKDDDNVFYTASEMVLDHASGHATAKHMLVHFHRVPILYFPFVSFPISDERKTGFLFPTIGFGDQWGVNFHLPFYWNIAPQQDATFDTHYMAARGIRFGAEYRYIGETDKGAFSGVARGEWLPDDKVRNQARYGWSFFHEQRVNDYWDGDIDVGYVSDRDYLQDLGDGLEVASASHIPQELRIGHRTDNTLINARLQQYQIIDPSVTENNEPYARLPGIDAEWDTPIRNRWFQFNVESSLNRFEHPVAARTQGTRFHLAPYGEMNFERTYGYLRPRVTVHHTQYELDGVGSRSASRLIPMLHIDSRLFLDRELSLGGAEYVQGLDAKVYYVYIPFEEQKALPKFDSGEVGFDNISNYYHRGRFYGVDRIGDTHRVTLGLETRVMEAATGYQRLGAQVAQMVFLNDRQVRLNGNAPPLTQRYSNLLSEMTIGLNENWRASAFSDWDWDEGAVSNFRLGLDYAKGARWQLSAGYWYKTDDGHDELSLDSTWPLGQRWQVGLRNIYTLDDKQNQYSAVSLGYDDCCWAIQVSVENEWADVDDGPQVMFTLRLKGLGSISSGEIARMYAATAPTD
jgi:LPS-assembly protein